MPSLAQGGAQAQATPASALLAMLTAYPYQQQPHPNPNASLNAAAAPTPQLPSFRTNALTDRFLTEVLPNFKVRRGLTLTARAAKP